MAPVVSDVLTVFKAQTLSVADTDLDITGLDINTDKVYVIDIFAETSKGSLDDLEMYIGDGSFDTTGSNYYREFARTGAASFSGAANAIISNMAANGFFHGRIILAQEPGANSVSAVIMEIGDSSNRKGALYSWRYEGTYTNVARIRFSAGNLTTDTHIIISRYEAGGGGGGGSLFNTGWEYDSTTAKADPGAGKFRLDNATMASVTEMYIDDLDKAGIDMGTWITGLSAGTHIRLGQTDSETAGALFEVDTTPTDETGYWTVPMTHIVDGTAGLTNAKVYAFQFEAAAPDPAGITRRTVAGASDTLVLSDANNGLEMTSAGSNAVTIPTNASVAYAVGTVINIMMQGAGQTTVTGDTGVTVNGASAGSENIGGQYKTLTIEKIATNTWVAYGSIL